MLLHSSTHIVRAEVGWLATIIYRKAPPLQDNSRFALRSRNRDNTFGIRLAIYFRGWKRGKTPGWTRNPSVTPGYRREGLHKKKHANTLKHKKTGLIANVTNLSYRCRSAQEWGITASRPPGACIENIVSLFYHSSRRKIPDPLYKV